MKILKPGNVPAPSRPWWLDAVFVCINCGAEFQLEEGEKPTRVITERRPDGYSKATVDCPVCGANVSVQRGHRVGVVR